MCGWPGKKDSDAIASSKHRLRIGCLKKIDISKTVMCDASVIGYDRRSSELSNATLHMK